MSTAQQPRATEENSHYRWLKGGARLLGRSSASWLLLWLAWVIAVLLLATTQPLLVVVLMGLSMMTFDLHVLAFDQMAASRPRLLSVFPQFFALLRKNARLYLKSFILRMLIISLVIVFSAGMVLALRHYASFPETGPTPENPGMFGLPWSFWTYAWFLPALFQRDGLISLRSWLVRRHGLPEEHAVGLQTLAVLRNFQQVRTFQRWIAIPSIVCTFLLPILLPVLELFWVACMRCMYQDMFEGGLGIQKQEEAAPAVQSVALPAAR